MVSAVLVGWALVLDAVPQVITNLQMVNVSDGCEDSTGVGDSIPIEEVKKDVKKS